MTRFFSLLLAVSLGFVACTSERFAVKENSFPDFITSNEEYYVTRIGEIPEVDTSIPLAKLEVRMGWRPGL